MSTLQHPSNYAIRLQHLPHSAAPYLHRLASGGVPAPSSSASWNKRKLHKMFHRGAHMSAFDQFKNFLFQDMLDMALKGYCVILPFHTVQHLLHLKLSPAGVMPQCTHRPHMIMHYSFMLVNQHSLPLAKTSIMQFGHALKCILQQIAYANPRHGPHHLMKLDLANGYY